MKRNIYDKGDYTAIKKHLSNIEWDIILSEKTVQQQWDVLVDINAKIVTANKILGIIRRTYMFLNKEIFLPLYKALVRSHFDYAI